MVDFDGEKYHVLIVDDNPTNIDILVSTLRDLYRLGVAKNGIKAIDYAQKNQPDLILLDIMMPEMDGYEVCRKLKSMDDTKSIGIIFITAMHKSENITRGFEYGAVDYIIKPFNTMEVLARVKTHLSLIGYRDHLEEMVRKRTIQLEMANDELLDLQREIIYKLGRAAEYKDYETGMHVLRVSSYCGIVAEALSLDPNFINLIRLCSPMHDLGKIGIPDRVLLKKGPLNDEEWVIMKSHCKIGSDILSPVFAGKNILSGEQSAAVDEMKKISDYRLIEISRIIAENHHEKWNGKGYPAGRKGEDIPIEARIVAIADVYDALSSKRSYKEAFDEDKCQQIITSSSGEHFDPAVVDAFTGSIKRIIDVKEELKDW